MTANQISNREKRRLRKTRLKAVARRADQPRLAAEQARNVARRIEAIRRAHALAAMLAVERTPINIEIVGRADLFVHRHALLFWRAMKEQAPEFECASCGMEMKPPTAPPAFAFVRRREVFDEDVWVLGVCATCASHPDLVDRVRKQVQRIVDREWPGEYLIAEVRVPAGAKR